MVNITIGREILLRRGKSDSPELYWRPWREKGAIYMYKYIRLPIESKPSNLRVHI